MKSVVLFCLTCLLGLMLRGPGADATTGKELYEFMHHEEHRSEA